MGTKIPGEVPNSAEVTNFNMYTATEEEWKAMNCSCDNHCDHCVGSTDRVNIYRCCNCGRQREVKKERLHSTSSTWSHDAQKHGPHAPSDIVRFQP